MAKPKWKIIYEHLQQGYKLKLQPNGKYALCHPQGGIANPDVSRATVNALEDRLLLVPTVWVAKEQVKSESIPLLSGVTLHISSKKRSVKVITND